ncbi:hypothetical protein HRbin26_01951 [bacterium HR26]|nr:hypothetical protein HRbin26_01951 [bacterium HR26]
MHQRVPQLLQDPPVDFELPAADDQLHLLAGSAGGVAHDARHLPEEVGDWLEPGQPGDVLQLRDHHAELLGGAGQLHVLEAGGQGRDPVAGHQHLLGQPPQPVEHVDRHANSRAQEIGIAGQPALALRLTTTLSDLYNGFDRRPGGRRAVFPTLRGGSGALERRGEGIEPAGSGSVTGQADQIGLDGRRRPEKEIDVLDLERCPSSQDVSELLGGVDQRHEVVQVQVAGTALGRVQVPEDLVEQVLPLGGRRRLLQLDQRRLDRFEPLAGLLQEHLDQLAVFGSHRRSPLPDRTPACAAQRG